ncbi:NUDIX domain-containing protein [Sphaerisporangium sp. TRM90804]|uniref:NUDIX hydrolase n=1 Tax=Sphaerisporangium sp. TRM90804 TaxID=3031113 RepID=UPI002449246E|nr:NUDIX domain-containing protein [Sphaerisporangium sp. TRM90804]MDH2426630.1 NUDIX domain-containing protein [Sphaerisporangium sp. TRM90804]
MSKWPRGLAMAVDEHVDALVEVLAGHRPLTDVEAADLERARALPAAGDPWHRSTALHVTVSALVVHPPTRRVLLRWHARQQAWLQVGGHADPGEVDPLAVASREAREETGLADLTPWPGPELVHVVIVPVAAGGREPAHEHADLRYVLATSTPDAVRPENPEARLRWLSVAEAGALTPEPNVRETLSRLDRLFDLHES